MFLKGFCFKLLYPTRGNLAWSSMPNARVTCLVVRHSSSSAYNGNNNNSSSSGFFDSVTESFSALRFKAANALTSSLPEEERNKLLHRLSPEKEEAKNKEEDKDKIMVPQLSLAELLAAAKAEEAERFSKQLEEEKEKILKEAEEAAKARVESDLAIQRNKLAFEKWKRDLERESNQASADNSGVVSTVQPSGSSHPILGPPICDLGHKRIHLTSLKALSTIPVWKKQRTYKHDRTKIMATDKMKTLHLGLPGVIGLYENKDGSLHILDGQHRLGMLNVLKQKQVTSEDFNFDQILVEVYPHYDNADEDTHAKEIFLEINKAEPVKLIDLPGVAKASHRNIINDGASRLNDRFPEMFKPSQKCRSPHLNVDNLRDTLFAAGVINRHSLKSGKALEEWMLSQNEVLEAKFQTDEGKESVSAIVLQKAVQYRFYLGLDNTWYYN